ncbi:TVP38/TMEM64 family protein [Alicyclobacillus dauci]|uniref:TVP38/TMEM64 family membrane protein n=1 Tax=Alicyclobacillus dauci TaxID=1475485 RepID=A0ABY6Z7G2_9BACL|nr:TVP38/TMEM64 family protein [Alicyclobacillus dauci]WAH38762.1 TVP38/TMEM64 family protein [Alicyclobacillus dauci]
MTRKIISLLLIAGIIVIAVTQKNWFTETMKSGGDIAIGISIVFIALLVFIPVVPFFVAAGLVGSVYGTWQGTAITLTGAMLGTIVMFLLVRFGFSSWTQKIIDKYPKAKQFESYFEHHAFGTVFVARLIPIIPTTLVNVLSGLSKISWVSFFFASLLGKLPVNILYNFAGREMTRNKLVAILIYAAYYLLVLVLTYIYLLREQKHKRID